ncbi:hypothetical protein U9M48_038216 [Paspalum notatum var. saurae]|uniref:Uncharacterized protein n=1 Tax=Paspalum notatum var. saurae TaxID=547442 RepID=A0AAQ3UGK5_PASNO
MLTTGKSADSLDAELRMGASTILKALHEFTRAVVKVFGPRYARKPNAHDTAKLLEVAEAHGFLGMLGSIDCMHWVWETCPTGWHGQYRGHANHPTMILEAVAGPDRWIWHSNFGASGSLNDINVLHRSSLFDDLLTGNAPPVEFTVNGNTYNMGYYLADGIYPNWATLIKGIPLPMDKKQQMFTSKQAACRKDVECAFGILQKKFAIIKSPCRAWYPDDMHYIMECCIILHNMTIEDERGMEHELGHEYEDSGLVQPRPSNHASIEAIYERQTKAVLPCPSASDM